jgi:hypothetical protein
MMAMPYRRTLLLLLVVAGIAGSASFLACSGDPAADGAECEDNGECNSGVCIGGSCAGRVCATIGSGDGCDQGWTCSLRGATPGLSCTKACTDNAGCPGGSHCSQGLCVAGKDITLTWVAKPGDAKCRLNARCRYEVRANGEGANDVASWTWTFGDAGVEGADADVEYVYPFAGLYTVTATPALKAGNRGPTLEAVEYVCTDDPEAECTPGGNDCCSGTCTLAHRCR